MVAAIGERPEIEAIWLGLASWPYGNRRDDEAAVVRVFWPTLRDDVEFGTPLHQTLRSLARHAKLLGQRAREIESRTWETVVDD